MNLRLYSFVNMYLIGIHAGIQSHHAAQEILNKYEYNDRWIPREPMEVGFYHPRQMFKDWSLHHKTDVFLNGGDYDNMNVLYELMSSDDLIDTLNNVSPWAAFYEPGLGNVMTAIAVVLPESIYDAVNYRTAVNMSESAPLFCSKYDRSFSEHFFWRNGSEQEEWEVYSPDSFVGRFLTFKSKCSLAR